jgi:hypothetical protein
MTNLHLHQRFPNDARNPEQRGQLLTIGEEPVRSLSFGTVTPRGSDWPYGSDASGWYYFFCGDEFLFPWENSVVASLTFCAPAQYVSNTTVLLTFEGVTYTVPAGMTQDLSQVQYLGQSPVSNDASTVSYLVTVNNSQSYTINQDSFQWPCFTANSIQPYYGCPLVYSDTLHNLSWTNFHNLFVRITGPTNVCVSYTYVNNNNSPANTLIANTNQIVLTAVGSANEDGSGIYSWSHSRGGTFSTNNCAAASTVTYFAPELASATPASASDTVTLTYTYHGQSYTTNQTLNILRPQTLQVNSQGVVTSPSCTATNGTSFRTGINYTILDQNGNPLGGSGSTMATWETFSSFVVGHPLTPNSVKEKGSVPHNRILTGKELLEKLRSWPDGCGWNMRAASITS